MAPISTPCRKLCTLDAAKVCRGCGRTLDEIAAWSRMSEAERRAIMADLPRRLAAERLASAARRSG